MIHMAEPNSQWLRLWEYVCSINILTKFTLRRTRLTQPIFQIRSVHIFYWSSAITWLYELITRFTHMTDWTNCGAYARKLVRRWCLEERQSQRAHRWAFLVAYHLDRLLKHFAWFIEDPNTFKTEDLLNKNLWLKW